MKSVAILFVVLVVATVALAAPHPGGVLGVGSPAVIGVGSPVLAGGWGGWGSPGLIGTSGIVGAPVIATSGLGLRTVGVSGIGLGGLGVGKIW